MREKEAMAPAARSAGLLRRFGMDGPSLSEQGSQQRLRSRVGRALLVPEVASATGLVVLIIIFELLSSHFLSAANISGTTTDISLVGIISVGVTLLMISGQFDLSVGVNAQLTAIVMGQLLADEHIAVLLALLVALGCAALIGVVNGVVTVYLRVPSFIATLGMYFFLDGLAFIITNGYSVNVFAYGGNVMNALGGSVTSALGAPFLWMIGIALVGGLILNGAQYGNWTFAAGSRDGTSARMIGVPVRRVYMTNFIVCAVLAGFAGIVSLAEYGSVSLGFASNYNLLAIVAAVLGGVSLFGGRGSIHGAIIGSAVLGVLETGFVIAGAPGTLYESVTGAVLVIAVLLNVRIEVVGRSLVMSRRGRT